MIIVWQQSYDLYEEFAKNNNCNIIITIIAILDRSGEVELFETDWYGCCVFEIDVYSSRIDPYGDCRIHEFCSGSFT